MIAAIKMYLMLKLLKDIQKGMILEIKLIGYMEIIQEFIDVKR